ncbi:MAG: DUF3102 domain-containing protein [Leptolyngbya sp. SIO1D8]|nr:DUF3102 domain-containing protein [Leptolyngbya sp. SIO1D8]
MQTTFDYQFLDADSRIVVQESVKTIKVCLRRVAKDIWKIGQQLVTVRSRLQYGQFIAWLKAEFDWTPRTAYNFINVYETFSDFESFSKIDAAASALYLLAAPSTSQDVRDIFLRRASSGEKITHKNVQKAIKDSKRKKTATHDQSESSQLSKPKLEIISLISSAESVKNTEDQKQTSTFPVNVSIITKSNWYFLQEQHYLFCGDTASSKFYERVPSAVLALAITSNDWDHDWLIEQASNVFILEEAAVNEKIVEQLILMFSSPGEIVIFPYLPIKGILKVGHKLKRKLYLGDSEPERCNEVVQYAGLGIQKLIS